MATARSRRGDCGGVRGLDDLTPPRRRWPFRRYQVDGRPSLAGPVVDVRVRAWNRARREGEGYARFFVTAPVRGALARRARNRGAGHRRLLRRDRPADPAAQPFGVTAAPAAADAFSAFGIGRLCDAIPGARERIPTLPISCASARPRVLLPAARSSTVIVRWSVATQPSWRINRSARETVSRVAPVQRASSSWLSEARSGSRLPADGPRRACARRRRDRAAAWRSARRCPASPGRRHRGWPPTTAARASGSAPSAASGRSRRNARSSSPCRMPASTSSTRSPCAPPLAAEGGHLADQLPAPADREHHLTMVRAEGDQPDAPASTSTTSSPAAPARRIGSEPATLRRRVSLPPTRRRPQAELPQKRDDDTRFSQP